MRNIISIILFFAHFIAYVCPIDAQVPVVKSSNKVIIGGKLYFIHQVAPGQTLYSISKAYEITENEIVQENPGSDKLLSVGQVLKIPAIPSPSAEPVIEKTFSREGDFRKHVIKQGETIYSLSRLYELPVQEIEKANPGLLLTDIPVGKEINIPQNTRPVELINFTYHKVRRRDTIYGICKKYKITEEELKRYNPELSESMPKPGQELRIPEREESRVPEFQEEIIAVIPDTSRESFIYADTLNNLTAYQYYLDSLPPISGRSFNVAYLIPFNYFDTSLIVSENKETPDPGKLVRKKQEEEQVILPESKSFLEFLEGTLLAIDKARQEGISVNVFFFDTKRSPERVREIISTPGFNKMDLIVGPFFSFNIEIVAPFSRQHHIPFVSPFYDDPELLSSNPFIFQLSPSYITEYNSIADYLVQGMNAENILLIHSPDSIPNTRKEYLSFKIKENIFGSENRDSINFNEIVYNNADRIGFQTNLSNALSKTKLNYIAINEIDEAIVKPLINQLYFLPRTYRIKLIGMSNWMTFQSIDYAYFHQMELSYFTPYYFNFDSAVVKNFLKQYISQFYSEPKSYTRKGCSYAFIGYDITNYFLGIIDRYGRRFITHLDDFQGENILGGFNFERTGRSGGFENRSLDLVTLTPDFKFIVVHYKNLQSNGIITSPVQFQE